MNVNEILDTAIRWHCPTCGWTYSDIAGYAYPVCTDDDCDMVCDDELYAPDDDDDGSYDPDDDPRYDLNDDDEK